MFSNTTKKDVLSHMDRHQREYSAAKPFPHIVIDNFLSEECLKECLFSIESEKDSLKWLQADHKGQVNKKWVQDCTNMPEEVARVVWWMNSSPMLNFVSNITGIDSIIPDSANEGGGIHYSSTGGKLGIHVDFNTHKKLGLKRRINALLFMNKHWSQAWGGDLELWKTDRSECSVKIEPKFNRLVMFNTDDTSYHGFPEALQCPEDRHRISIAMYYYTFEDEESFSKINKRTGALFYD